MPKKEMILIAGPYRSGTGDDPAKIAANMEVMNEAALHVFNKGFIPLLGEWFALPLIEQAGSKQIGDKIFNEIFHPIAVDLIHHCDGVLRTGGPSQGADQMVITAKRLSKKVFTSVEEISF
ncbi:DUF4406 domain-containing protein [Rhodocytophaga aerolata]|uniref:DUF4406 domain-containing protein n=1 Tax=Rhodocytophaga aerolata TaxID=455078 RepID=A0ABT8R4H3_9BACT|nr:DUF4406 domain-containing protein [Rhodocytophaga aerolata]MDO1445647.1 DUF4406 domain-containing protein [Rhodocytophaga aerolata]